MLISHFRLGSKPLGEVVFLKKNTVPIFKNFHFYEIKKHCKTLSLRSSVLE